jgi:Protein of unknown function (DUF692)
VSSIRGGSSSVILLYGIPSTERSCAVVPKGVPVIARTGPLPTLIEWDNDVPDWPTLAAEARAAKAVLDEAARLRAA